MHRIVQSAARILITLRAMVAVVACGFVVAACVAGGDGTTTGSVTTPPAADGPAEKRAPVKVALILPLSGNAQTAVIGKSLKQAGELALFEFDNPTVQLIVKDDKGTPEGAKAAAEEAVQAGVELIVGPLFAASVQAMAPVAQAAKIPVLALSSDRRVAGGGTYLMSFLAGQDVARIVGHAAGAGKRRYAALIQADEAGKAIEQAFRDAVARAGGTVVFLERYPPHDTNGMIEPLKHLKEAQKQAAGRDPIDVLYLPGSQDTLVELAPLLPYYGIETSSLMILGSVGWDAGTVGRDAVLVGARYPGPDPRGWREFSERFAKTYGVMPPRLASVTYDAVSLAVALSAAAPGQRFTRENLTRPSGFNGVDGLFRLMADGTSERSLAVLEVQKFGSNLIEPPSAGFGASGYSGLGVAGRLN